MTVTALEPGNTRPRVPASNRTQRREARQGERRRSGCSRFAASTTFGYDSRRGGVFLNNRYHDPTLGTFISVDPLVAMTGEPYIYASGNPTTLSDPTGLEPGCSATATTRQVAICAASHADARYLANTSGGRQVTGQTWWESRSPDEQLPSWSMTLPSAPPPSATSSCGGVISPGCVVRVTNQDGGVVELIVPDVDVPGLDLVVGACATASASFIVHLGVSGCSVASGDGNSVLVTGEIGTGAGIAGGVGAGGLVTNAGDVDDLLGFSVCGGASGTVGAGIEGSICLGLTGLYGAEFTGTWSFYGGASFGAGVEGHVSLAYTHELFDTPSVQCNPIAYATPLVAVSVLTC